MFGEEQDRANTDEASPSFPFTPNYSGDFLSLLRFVYLTACIGFPLQVLDDFLQSLDIQKSLRGRLFGPDKNFWETRMIVFASFKPVHLSFKNFS